MEALAVSNLIAGGETSRVQFKLNVTNVTSIAQEMVAFANTRGGMILIGVHDKTGQVDGLSFQDIQRINNLLVTAANEHVKSAINIETDTVEIEPDKRLIVVRVPEGHNKPYKDNDGLIFIKNGADKRKVTSNEEIMRMLQSSGSLYAEEMVLHHCTYDDIDWGKFKTFYENKYSKPFIARDKERIFENLRMGQHGKPLLAGALLFTNNAQKAITGFFITGIWFFGNERSGRHYVESENMTGTLREQYDKAMQMLKRALRRTQQGQSFNSLGKLEIPESVFEELLTNALIHRDYFVRDTIKLFIYENRIEIISPGKLPNSLTVEQMKVGIRKKRNNILDSLAPDILEYRGSGSGILHALEVYPHIEFINDTEAELFTVTIERPKL